MSSGERGFSELVSTFLGDTYSRTEFLGCLHGFLDKKDLGPTIVHFDLDSLNFSVGHANKFSVASSLFEKDIYNCFNMIV